MVETTGFFSSFYRNAKQNSVIIMDNEGVILQVNPAFVTAFGYEEKDVEGKHFRMLFTEEDKKSDKPEREVNTALVEGSKSDNNYLVHSDGTPIWVNGESVLVTNGKHEKFIVKIIHNIHAQKQLERFLLESNEFIDSIFESIKDIGLMIVDSSMKIVKTNKAFLKMFGIKKTIEEGSKLSAIDHVFWKRDDIRDDVRNTIVKQEPVKNKIYSFENESGKRSLDISLKPMDGIGTGKSILVVIKEIK